MYTVYSYYILLRLNMQSSSASVSGYESDDPDNPDVVQPNYEVGFIPQGSN